MIQRIQSLLLLGSLLISILLIYLPVYERIPPIGSDPSIIARQTLISDSAILLIINGATGVLSFFAIFLFKIRNIQHRMCNLGLLLTCVLIGLLFFMADTTSSQTEQKIHYLYGSYLPLIQILLLFLASRYIKKDDELVRSADRLR
jgi:hypothetical protein